jgi:hypothetical protein
LVKSAPEICQAVQKSAPDAIMFNVHGSPEGFSFNGWPLISDFPRTCFTTVKKKLTFFLKSCNTAKGSSSIAEKMSDLLPPNSTVTAPSCATSHFEIDLNKDPPIRFQSHWEECETRTFSSPNYCSTMASPPVKWLSTSQILSEFPKFVFAVYRLANDLSFALKVTGFVLEKSPTLFWALSSTTRNLLIKPALYCGTVTGLIQQKRVEILDRWKQAEESVYEGLRIAAQYAPYIEQPAQWIDCFLHAAIKTGIVTTLIATNILSNCSCWVIDKISSPFNHRKGVGLLTKMIKAPWVILEAGSNYLICEMTEAYARALDAYLNN